MPQGKADTWNTLSLAAIFTGMLFAVLELGAGAQDPVTAFAFAVMALLLEPVFWEKLQGGFTSAPWRWAIYAANTLFWGGFLSYHLLAGPGDALLPEQLLIVILLLLCVDFVFREHFSLRTVPLLILVGFHGTLAGELPLAVLAFCLCLVVVLDRRRRREQADRMEHLRRTEERLRVAVRQLREQEILANHDELTGVMNRRGFDNVAGSLFGQSDQHAFALVVLDIDHFKEVNDTYGHAAGDTVLRELVARLLGVVRPDVDFIGRFGGDELLVGSVSIQTPEQLLAFMERLRMAAGGAPFDGGIDASVSLGGALYPHCGAATYEDLFRLADDALYRSKRSRDRSTVYGL